MSQPAQGSRKLAKGDALFKEGDMSNSMYLIRSGMIRIFKKKGEQQIEIDTLRTGQIVGEMAFLDGQARSASAEALMDNTEIVEISQDIYQQTMGSTPEWLKVLLKATVARLRTTTTKLKQLESASSTVDYSGDGSKRNFIFLSPHDALKVGTAVLLVASRSPDETPEGKRARLPAVERYANQIMGIPIAKITSFIECLKQVGIAHVPDKGDEIFIRDMPTLENYIAFTSDENLLEPAKRHDLTVRGFLVMGLLAKHLDKYPKDQAGNAKVNVAEIRATEQQAMGKEPFRMDEFAELVKHGYGTTLDLKSGSEQYTTVHVDTFQKAFRIHRVAKILEALNEQKQKTQLGMK